MASISPAAPQTARREAPWVAYGALLSVALIWGVNVPVMKYALSEMHPFAFNAVRLPLSALLLGLLALREMRSTRRGRMSVSTVLRVALVGVLGSLLYQILFITGLERTSAGSVGLIIATAPLWTAVIARLFGVERIGAYAWAGLAVAFLGAATVTLEGGVIDLARGSLRGNLLVLTAALSWSTSTVLSKSLVEGVSPTWLAFMMTALVVPFHVILGWPHLGVVWRLELGAATWWAIAFSGLLSTGLSYAFWYFGVSQVGPSHTAIYTSLVPVITLVSSVWMLGEAVTWWQMAGGTLVLGGLAIMQRFRSSRRLVGRTT